jgi:hypothetical protein
VLKEDCSLGSTGQLSSTRKTWCIDLVEKVGNLANVSCMWYTLQNGPGYCLDNWIDHCYQQAHSSHLWICELIYWKVRCLGALTTLVTPVVVRRILVQVWIFEKVSSVRWRPLCSIVPLTALQPWEDVVRQKVAQRRGEDKGEGQGWRVDYEMSLDVFTYYMWHLVDRQVAQKKRHLLKL